MLDLFGSVWVCVLVWVCNKINLGFGLGLGLFGSGSVTCFYFVSGFAPIVS
ncbi:hypothetical protein LINPERPRIM_LOCUS32927 [Linum perenne]